MSTPLWIIIVTMIILVVLLVMYQRDIYVVRAHVCDDHLKTFWDKITHELSPVYLIFDNTNKSMQPDFYEKNKDRIIMIDNAYCKSINKLHVNNLLNVDTTLAILYRHFKWHLYSYVWLIENDIYCDGNWKACLDKAYMLPFDFCATLVQYYGEHNNLNWPHWKSTTLPVPIEKRMRSFFPLTRYTPQMLVTINKYIGIYSGFCEVYMPTLARMHGLTFGNFPDTMIGNFDYRIVPLVHRRENKVYHKALPT